MTARFLKFTMIDSFGGEYFVISDLEAGLLGSTDAPSRRSFRYLLQTPEELAPTSRRPDPASGVDVAPPRTITLTATRRKVRRGHRVALRWTGARSSRIDVYRNGTKVSSTANDGAQA